MDFLKRFGFWIGIGAAALAAVVFYGVVVRAQRQIYEEKLDELRAIQSSIKARDRGAETPNEAFIEHAGKVAEVVDREIAALQELIVSQRRRNHTKLFWHRDDPMRRSVTDRSTWSNLYEEYVYELQRDVLDSGIAGTGIVGISPETTALPTWPQIRNSQVHFWLTRDIIDILINQGERDIERILEELEDPRLASFFDVVKNREPGELSKSLQALGKDRLSAILEDILVNERQLTLGRIFEEHGIRDMVERHTVSEHQRAFVNSLRNPNRHDREDLVNIIEDVRWVRYRDDLAGLYRNHGFDGLARALRDWGADTRRMLIDDIRGPAWRPLRLAQAIETAVSISTERDFNTILATHRPSIAVVDSLSIPQVALFREERPERPGMRDPYDDMYEDDMYDEPGRGLETRQVEGLPGVYNALPFDMAVTIELRRVPILVRRLLRSDWRIEIHSLDIAKSTYRPTVVTDDPRDMFDDDMYDDYDDMYDPRLGGLAPPGARRPGGLAPPGARRPGGLAPPGTRRPGARRPDGLAPPGGARPGERRPGEAPAVDGEGVEEEAREAVAPPSHYVRVQLAGEARQFYPLWKELNPEAAEAIENRFAR